MKPELIIFDCDGTIADTEDINNQATADTLAQHGYPQYDYDFCITQFVGTDMTSIKKYVEAKENTTLPDHFISEFIQLALQRMQGGLKPIPHAPQAIDVLSKKYKICVASNGERNNVIQSVRSIGAYDYFGEDKIFTKHQVARGKPAPDLFLFAAEKMGVLPEHSIVIEDSIAGVTAGLAAGMMTIGIIGTNHHPERIRQDMQKAGVAHVCDTWPDIIRLIEELERN